MLRNKKGAALLQVLLVAAVLAGLATMLLRVSLSRTSAARHTRRTVAAQLLISRCQAEVNAFWSAKPEQKFAKDLEACRMYCKSYDSNTGECRTGQSETEYHCGCQTGSNGTECVYTQMVDGQTVHYTVTAKIGFPNGGSENNEGQCEMTYTVTDDVSSLTEVVL